MTRSRPKALVTAAVSGPGLDLLHQLADLVLDSWLDQPTLRIYNAKQLAERAAAEGAIDRHRRERCRAALSSTSSRSSPLPAAGATRPTSTWRPPPPPGSRSFGRRAATRTPSPSWPWRSSSRPPAAWSRPTATCGRARSTETARSPYQRYRAWELAGKTVGLVGLGAVGRALRWRLRGLGHGRAGLRPLRRRRHRTLDDLFERSDVISVHAPVTDETTGLIDADAFAKMRDGVVYLNTARAKIHDTDALVAALASGKVGAAGLDHFEGELWPPITR